jgi:SPP1 gp7 family putative phage head morphogenesis protein
VARGLEHGLGRDEIAGDLAEAAELALVDRARSYWDVVAASFVGEARSMSQMSSYAEAGIDRYMLVAVLDEHTTDTCRFLDGKVLDIADAMRTFDRLEASDDPLAIKKERPWVRERVGDDGRRVLAIDRGGESTVLAVVERSGVGARADRGTFAREVSARYLAPAGVGFPPFHGLCRTTTVADT